MEESGAEQGLSFTTQSSELRSREESKELAKAAEGYKAILENCFDANGQPKKDAYGYELFKPFRYGYDPERSYQRALSPSVQLALLGFRPFFAVKSEFGSILQHNPEFTNRFFVFDKGRDFKNYGTQNLEIYIPDQVKEVLKQNPDLFDGYTDDKPLDLYLADKIQLDRFEDEGLLNNPDPHKALLMVNPDNSKEETPFVFGKSDETWSLEQARMQALRLGVLLGYPRALLEKSLDRQWEQRVANNRAEQKGREPEFYIYDYPNTVAGAFYLKDIDMGQEGIEFKQKVESALRDSGMEKIHKQYMRQYEKRKRSPLVKVVKGMLGYK